MISNRSAGLALAALLLSASCQHTGSHSESVRDVRDSSPSHSSSHYQAPAEPEYIEAQTAPEVPAALPEERPSAPSPDHVWIAGQHTRRHGEWVWVPGQWALPPRDDVVWVPGHFVPHLAGYVWIAGAWR